MSADAMEVDLSNKDGEQISPDQGNEHAPRFRVIRSGGAKRGIRLEGIFWSALERLARRQDRSVGSIIDEIVRSFPDPPNLTSIVRVRVVTWFLNEIEDLSGYVGTKMIDRLVKACPSPALALSEDKRIIAHNPAFLQYVSSNLSRLSHGFAPQALRLSLDVPIADLIASLRSSDNTPVVTGFALGVNDQRLRGRLNAILAPSADRPTIIGYVVLA